MANVSVFGDSIAQGYFDKEGGWVDRLKKYFLNQEIDGKISRSVNVFNLGKSGDTSREIGVRFKQEASPRKWGTHKAVLILAIGLNDSIIINGHAKVTKQQFKKNLVKIINASKSLSGQTIFVGPTPVDESKVTPMPWSETEYYHNERIGEYDKTIQEVCEKYKLGYVNLFKIFNNLEYKKLLYDGAHPNTEGHKLIFETVKDFLIDKKYV